MAKAVVQLAETASNPEDLLKDPGWWVEQKLDGHRVLVILGDGAVKATNRQGAAKCFPKRIAEQLLPLANVDMQLDGELVGNTFFVFDSPMAHFSERTRIENSTPLSTRRTFLEALFSERMADAWPEHPNVVLIDTHRTPAAKQRLFNAAQAGSREGVMFKKLDAPYRQGRQHSWLKHKFVKTCEVVVTELNRKGKVEAMSIGLYDQDGVLRPAGGCRVLPKFLGKVELGSVVEVRYLYGTSDFKLYQPVLLRIRDDKRPEECGQWQLQMTNKASLKI
jgi:bifunctional non-homologous end joining protein LigD